jgi:endo-1,4-beta-D-glucanase Y
LAVVLVASSCRDDKPMPPVENLGTGGTGTGGKGGAGGAKGTGGAKADAGKDTAMQVDSGADAVVPGGDAGASDVVVGDTGGTSDVVVSDVVSGDVAPSAAAMRPFGALPVYPAGVIRPTGAQPTLDAAVVTFYTTWKRDYVKNGCGGSYVLAPTSEGANTATTSEIHGAGMLAVVLMAGQDTAAKTTFDNLYNFARMNKSAGSPVLMAARVGRTGNQPCTSAGADARTEGDLHVAMALLMADKQWGSAGTINYLEQAKATIAAIKAKLFNATTKLPLQGDYAGADPALATNVRTSELWPGHYQAFAAATGDAFWSEAIGATYTLIGKIQAGPSMASGLIPDHIINTATATPSPGAGTDGHYWYEAVRVPLGLTLDYLSNSARPPSAKPVLEKINAFIKAKAGGVPASVRDAYLLDGTVKVASDVGDSPLFESTFAAAAIVDPAHQAWLDALWTRISKDSLNAESNVQTIQLLSLLAISGHWWAP